jgi:hypothetical protein
MDLLVGVDGLEDQLGANRLAVAHIRGCDEAFDVELVREEEEADEGLTVVGLADARSEAADVGEDEDAGAVGGGEAQCGEDEKGEPR